MLCVLPQHEIPRSFPGLKLPKLCFLLCRCLLMDLPDSSRAFRSPPLEGEKKKRGTMGKRWPSELVWYYILFQSYTITNWNHITAPNWGPDNLLKGTIPSEARPLTPGLPAIFRRMTWLRLQRLYACTHRHTHTISGFHHSFFWHHLKNIKAQNSNLSKS